MMVMKRLLTLSFVITTTLCSLSAQVVITTDELGENVSTYTSENYTSHVENQTKMNQAKSSLNIPSLECNNSLQVGRGGSRSVLRALWALEHVAFVIR